MVNIQIIKSLIDNGANVNTIFKETTLLNKVVGFTSNETESRKKENDQSELIKLFLSKNIIAADKYNNTQFHYVDTAAEAIELLKANPRIDLNTLNSNGKLALQVQIDALEIIKGDIRSLLADIKRDEKSIDGINVTKKDLYAWKFEIAGFNNSILISKYVQARYIGLQDDRLKIISLIKTEMNKYFTKESFKKHEALFKINLS